MESVNPVEIGGHARKFLTSPRLEKLNKEFEQNGGEWKEFKIGELFSVSSNPQLNKESFHFSTNGQYPYFTRTVFNNGILGYVDYLDDEHKISGNSIAVGMLGMQFFYMPSDFYAGQFTKTVFSKFKKFNEKLAIYFIAFFNKLQKMLQGVLVRDFEKIFCESKMLLPATRDGMPNFSYMEQYIGELEQARVSELAAYLRAAGLENYDLTAAEQTALDDFKNNRLNFKEFKIGNLFEISTPKKKFNANSVKFGGRFPYVVRTSLNNGIRDFLDEDERFLNSAGTISFGQDTATIFYQEKPYFTGDKIKILRFKIMNLNEKIANFMLTLMRKSFSHFQWGQSSFNENVLKNVAIKLPVTNDAPDFTFMESFITAQQKLAIRDVVLWKDKVISETRKIANV